MSPQSPRDLAERSGRVLAAVHAEPPFQDGARACSRAREGMYFYDPSGRALLDACSGLWCVNAGHGREHDHRGDSPRRRRTRFRADIPVRPSRRLRAGRTYGGAGAGRHGSCLLRQFRFGSRRHRAEAGARLSSQARAGPALPPDRPREGLSRRHLRRAVGRRHRQQPQALRPAYSGYGRSSAAAL